MTSNKKPQKVNKPQNLQRRKPDAHKGDFGRILIVGGSTGMIGAPALAALAALRSGAGLVTIAVPATIQQAVATLCPCATSIPLSCSADGMLDSRAAPQVRSAAETCDVVAAGPGLGVSTAACDIVRALIESSGHIVLDADGLNNLAAIDDWASIRQCDLVITPHPGEFSRLTGKEISEIQANRSEHAVKATANWAQQGSGKSELVCLLKGAATVVTNASAIYTNTTGNPGMASGGSGDVLTGIIAALIAQNLTPFDATCLAAHLHGLAGDLAAAKLGQTSLIATDLLDYLPKAFMS